MTVQDIEADLQSREEVSVVDERSDDTSVAPVQYDISSYGADYDVEGLVKRLNRGDILNTKFSTQLRLEPAGGIPLR